MDWDEHFKRVSRIARQPASFGADFGASKDLNVLAVQHALNLHGASPKLVEDGVYGPATRAALIDFQRKSNISQTGIVDAATLAKLGITLQKLPPLPTISLPPISGVKQIVVNSFPAFSTKFEGHTNKMYADSKHFVTTGVGNKIDPIDQALVLPWKHESDGSPVSQDDISFAWHIIKSGPGGSYGSQAKLTNIYLTDADVAKLVSDHMAMDHSYLSSEYPNYHSWPADAQLALHSISWAWGPAFAHVWGDLGNAFKAAVNSNVPDFAKAADVMTQASQHEESINPGIVPRNVANRTLFSNAHNVVASNSDPNSLFYPNDFLTGAVAFAKKHAAAGGVIAAIALAIGVLLLAGKSS